MANRNEKFEKNGRIIIQRFAHHNPERDDFGDHVFYLFHHAFCIGCSAFLLGTIVSLILGNLFYYYIVLFIDFTLIMVFFIICWMSSILQYSFQIIKQRALKNRTLKFIIRFLYPLGSIILIFKSPIIGLILAIPAGYAIVYIRKIKEKKLK